MVYPDSYNNLKYRHRVFVDCYLSQTLREETLMQNTYNNELASYVFAYQKQMELADAVEVKFYYTDGFGVTQLANTWNDSCRTEIVVKNVQKYMSLSKCARKVHGECMRAINDIRNILYNSEDKSRELELKDAIYNSSINAKDFKDRNDNRKMMMKIMGLDQIKIDTSVDIYQASGKQVLARLKGESGGNGDEPIIPIDIDDIDGDGE